MKNRLSFTINIIGMCIVAFYLLPFTTIASQKVEINLETALQTALRDNHSLKLIREKVKVAQAKYDGIALLSNLELETELLGGNNSEQIVELSKTFELGGQRSHRRRIAQVNLEKVKLDLINESRLLTKSVKLAFFQLNLVQEKLGLAKEIIKHNQQMYEMAQFQFESGDISVTQVGLANIQLQSALREFTTLESTLQLVQLDLNGLMGTPLDTLHTAIGGFPEKTNHNLELEKLKTLAIVHRADLKSLKLNLQATESIHRLAKASNIPDISIGGIAERSSNETAFGVKLSIPLPLFDRNRAEIDASKALKQEDTVHIINYERQINREVIAAFLTITAAEKNLKFYDNNVLKLVNDNLTLTRTSYELGEAELLEVILIQNEFIKTRFAYLDALVAYHIAYTQLESAIGTSIELLQ